MDNPLSLLVGIGALAFLFWLFFSIVLFFVIREITLWYFRINENTEAIKSMANSLEKIAIAAEFFTTDLVETHNNKIASKKITDEAGLEKKIS